MCDDKTERDNETFLSRRQFTALATATAVSAMLPTSAHAAPLTEVDVTINTPDGEADAYFVHPADTKAPAVLIWPDILGLRPAFRAMGKRLAGEGYAVLVVNPFYRSAKSPVVAEGASFKDQAVRDHVLPMAKALSAETHVTDAKAFVAFLDQHDAVDTQKKVGTMGYCMGGPMVMRTAATLPDRLGAGATFHGGGLATDAADSPHLGIPNMKAQFLIAIASNDDEQDPKSKETLRAAFEKAGLSAEIEVYQGVMHGWCPPDSSVYDEAQAEKAWARMLALFEKALV